MKVLRCLLLFVAPAIAAESTTTAPKENERGGFILGVTGGFTMGTASGYPNDLEKIDVPMYLAQGGFQVGESSGLLIMGSFIRELNFGIWLNQATSSSTSGNWHSSAYGGGFRVEVFPLGWILPALRDIGVIGQFGIGGGNLVANVGDSPGADGVQSYVGTGAFWEWMFAHPGKMRWVVGPSLEYQLVTSRPFERSAVMLGLRFAFYTGK
jgi:hypothetical protein